MEILPFLFAVNRTENAVVLPGRLIIQQNKHLNRHSTILWKTLWITMLIYLASA